MSFITVVTICDNVVKDVKLFNDPTKAEELFIEKIKEFGIVDEEDIQNCLDNGYVENSEETICLAHPENNTDPTKLIIILDGGLIQEVYSTSNTDILKIDLDIEGAQEEELSLFPDSDGNLTSAFIEPFKVDVAPDYCERVFNHIKEEDNTYSVEKWKQEVQNDNTTLGYNEWVLTEKGEE